MIHAHDVIYSLSKVLDTLGPEECGVCGDCLDKIGILGRYMVDDGTEIETLCGLMLIAGVMAQKNEARKVQPPV